MSILKLNDLKMSDLLDRTINDVAKCARSRKYIFNMRDWHVPQDDGLCAICMAGAVLAQTTPPSVAMSADDRTFSEEAFMWTIDNIRTGCFFSAAASAKVSNVSQYAELFNNLRLFVHKHSLGQIPDGKLRRTWYRRWRSVAARLREAGI